MKKKNGFTVIEILVSATIFSIIALGIGSTFLTGMKIWNRLQKDNFLEQQIPLTLEIIAKNLRQSILSSHIKFSGTEQKISFPCLIGKSIIELTYKFNPQENSIWQIQADLKDILAKKQTVKEKKILSSLKDLKISYLDFADKKQKEYKWKKTWEKTESMPIAVKFEINTENHIYAKTVFIPLSKSW